jgi:ATP-binding cassette subfamily F protein 3
VFYADQHHAGLDPAMSAYDVLAAATELSSNQIYYVLARMQLKNRLAHKLVGALSGGERTRLTLALLVNARAGLLILDEPTSHLDLPSIEVLERALAEYAGAVLFVTHDRRFIRSVATEVWELSEGKLAGA